MPDQPAIHIPLAPVDHGDEPAVLVGSLNIGLDPPMEDDRFEGSRGLVAVRLVPPGGVHPLRPHVAAIETGP